MKGNFLWQIRMNKLEICKSFFFKYILVLLLVVITFIFIMILKIGSNRIVQLVRPLAGHSSDLVWSFRLESGQT